MTFLIFALLFYICGLWDIFLLGIVFALVHEIGHIIAIYIVGAGSFRVRLSFQGINLIYDAKLRSYGSDAFVAFCGPFLNLLLFIIFYLYFKSNPLNESYAYISAINFALALINLLPIFPLDGYTIFKSFLMVSSDYSTAMKISNGVSKFFLFLLLLAGIVILLLSGYNLSLLLIWLCLFIENRSGRYMVAEKGALV